MIKFTSLYISSGKLLSDTIVVVLNNSILSVCTLFQLLAAIKIIKINAKFTPDEMDQARLWLNQTFEGVTAMTTGFDNIDIIPNGSNKSVGLNHLCSHFGITGRHVVAFGDNQNDLDMLDFAGLAIATENAREEVRALADQIIGHCNDGAVLA